MRDKTRWVRRAAAAAAAVVMLAACSGESETQLLDSARGYIQKKELRSAVLQLKSTLQKNPNNAEARYLLGQVLLDSGEPVNAAVELRKAQELKHDPVVLVPTLARAMLASNEARKLVDEFGDTRLPNPRAQADLLTSLSAAFAVLKDLDQARAAVTEAQAVMPDFAPALVLDARLKAADKDVDGALALLAQVLAKDPANDEALLFKGELLAYGKQDNAGAIEAWRAALTHRPNLLPAHTAIIAALLQANDVPGATAQVEALKKAHPNHPDTKFYEAQLAFIAKDFKVAREHLDAVLKLRPDDPFALQLAGLADYQLQSYVTSENFLARALKAQPGLGLARETLAQIYLRTGQPNKAVDLLKPMIGVAKPEARVLALAGEAYRQSGDTRRADELFAQAGKADPKNRGVQAVVALNQANKGDEKALGELEALAAADTGTRTDLAVIRAHLGRKNLDGALKAIDALQKKQPDKALAYHLRGRVLLLKNDEPGARKNFEKALELEKAFTPAAASLAALDLRAKQPDAAKKRLDDVLAADPANLQAMIAMADLKSRTGGTKEEVAAQLQQAIKAHPAAARPRTLLVNHLLATGDAKAALTAARDASAAMPENLEVLEALGVAQLRGGDQQQAVSTFKKLASLQPTRPQPQLRLAEAMMASRDSDGARIALRRALELQPDLLPAQRGLVDIAIADRKLLDALAIARDVQKQRPAEAIGWVLEGDAESARRGWEPALAAYRTALSKAKVTDVAGRVYRTMVESGKAAEAERFAAGWMAEHPKDVLFLFQQGDVAISKKQWAEAEAFYRGVVKLQPDSALAHNNIAWLLVQQAKPGALEHAEKANQLLPERAPLMDTLALALLAEGQAPKALEVQKRALEKAPESPTLRLTLARIYAKTGAKDQAKTELDKLARLGEKFPQQAEVAELLKTL